MLCIEVSGGGVVYCWWGLFCRFYCMQGDIFSTDLLSVDSVIFVRRDSKVLVKAGHVKCITTCEV